MKQVIGLLIISMILLNSGFAQVKNDTPIDSISVDPIGYIVADYSWDGFTEFTVIKAIYDKQSIPKDKKIYKTVEDAKKRITERKVMEAVDTGVFFSFAATMIVIIVKLVKLSS